MVCKVNYLYQTAISFNKTKRGFCKASFFLIHKLLELITQSESDIKIKVVIVIVKPNFGSKIKRD